MRKTRIWPTEVPSADDLEAELSNIRALSLDELRAYWRKMTGRNAPKILARDLLFRMIAHAIQEQVVVRLSYETRKLLERLAKDDGGPVRHLKIGTALVREHQGRVHQVIVVPGGFSWQEKIYPSLSAIARAITGTSWNGPRFFGLRGESGTADFVEQPETTAAESKPRISTRTSVRAGRGSLQRVEAAP
jgi:hypothetical protein